MFVFSSIPTKTETIPTGELFALPQASKTAIQATQFQYIFNAGSPKC